MVYTGHRLRESSLFFLAFGCSTGVGTHFQEFLSKSKFFTLPSLESTRRVSCLFIESLPGELVKLQGKTLSQRQREAHEVGNCLESRSSSNFPAGPTTREASYQSYKEDGK